MHADTVFDLPLCQVGAFGFQAVPTDRAMIPANARYLLDFDRRAAWMDYTLQPKPALELYTRILVKLLHFRSGLNDKSDEESFTQSLANGMTDLACGDQAFWVAYNDLLAKQLSPRSRWRGAALYTGSEPPDRRPKRVVFKDRVCQLRVVDGVWFREKHGAYGWYQSRHLDAQDYIELGDTLFGPESATGFVASIVLHEVLHFLHDCRQLRDSTSAARFEREQAAAFLSFIQQNPGFWRWWLHLAQPKHSA